MPVARPLPAQERPVVVERVTPFDSAGRVVVLTPALVARLPQDARAALPAGAFVEARLFATSDGGAVLALLRPGGIVERTAYTAAERATLVATVTRGLAARGALALRVDTASIVSEPAGRGFVRSQVTRGLVLYGPAAAALVADPAGSTLAYVGAVGAAFVVSLGATGERTITRAQTYLSGNMAYGGAAAAAGLVSLFEPTRDEGRLYAGAALVGGIAGSVAGVKRAARLSDAEAASAGAAALLAAATTIGTGAALGAYWRGGEQRPATAAGVAALVAGYALGPRYAHATRYAVTAGDAQSLLPAALVGAGLGAGTGILATRDDRARVAAATAGLVAGAALGHATLVTGFDHTPSEGGLVRLGTFVGAAVGFGIATAAEMEEGGGTLVTAVGGLAGLAATEGFIRSSAAGPRGVLRTGEARLRWTPVGAAFAVAGVHGRFPLATVTF